MARTVLHARLQAQVDALRGVEHRLSHTGAQIAGIDTAITSASSSVSTRLADLSTKLDLLYTLIVSGREGPKPTDVRPAAFDCVRVLNQVEDIVTDRDFSLPRNNESLHHRAAEDPTQACDASLQYNQGLQGRFRNVYRDFPDESLDTRAGRYLELDQLRRDIVLYFAGMSTSTGAPRPNKRERRQKR